MMRQQQGTPKLTAAVRERSAAASGTRLWLNRLNLEITSQCNMNCRYCSLRQRARREHMTLELLRTVLAQLTDDSALRVKTLCLYQGGELFLHPQWPEVLRLLAAAKAGNALFPRVMASTNATLLTPEIIATVLASGAIDIMQFSFDGGTPGEFAAIRPGVSWKLVRRNITAFLDCRDARRAPVYALLNTTTTRKTADFPRQCAPAWRSLYARVDRINVHPPQQLDTRLESGYISAPDYNGVCVLADEALSVMADGAVAPCCAYLENSFNVGELRNNTLTQIYHGAARRELLRNMQAGRRRKNELCRYCNVKEHGVVVTDYVPWVVHRDRPEYDDAQLVVRLRALAGKVGPSERAELVIFGSGETGRWVAGLAALAGLRLRCFVDNDPRRIGADDLPAPVLAPAALHGQIPVPVVIASRARPRALADEFTRLFPEWPCYNLLAWLGP